MTEEERRVVQHFKDIVYNHNLCKYDIYNIKHSDLKTLVDLIERTTNAPTVHNSNS